MIVLLILLGIGAIFGALELWVRIVVDPWMEECDPDNDGVRKIKKTQ